MKKITLINILLAILLLLFFCRIPLFAEELYYGADLSEFPPKVREWIYKTFSETVMRRDGASSLIVRWIDDNNIRVDTFSRWGRYNGPNLSIYGQYRRFHTLRFQWEYKQKVEEQLRTDPVYAEIIEYAKRLCEELEYDWSSFSGYRGRVIPTPGKRYMLCSGYADEVMNTALELESVASVQLWRGPNHAWNVLKLVDGRTLYFDLTWFDNEHIDNRTGRVYQTDDYSWMNITFDEEIFRFANVGYGTRQFTHNHGTFTGIEKFKEQSYSETSVSEQLP